MSKRTPGAAPAGPLSAGPAAGAADGEAEAMTFEDAFQALSDVVADLESGGQPLEAALSLYERGVALAARCDHLLQAAELRVRQVDASGADAGEVAL